MGFHRTLAAEAYDRQYSNKVLFARIWEYVKPHRKRLMIILGAVILQGIGGSLPALLVSRILNEGIAGIPDHQLFTLLVVAVILLELTGYLLYYVNRRLMVRVISGINQKISTDAFSASMHQDMAFHDSFSSGKIVSRITTDTRDFTQLITVTTDALNSLLQSLFIAIILLRTEWRLALLLLLVVPVLTLFITLYRNVARRATRQGMRAIAEVNATIKETISGIAVAKNFRQEDAILDEFTESNNKSYTVNIRRGFTLSVVFPITRSITGLAVALITYSGAKSVLSGLIDAGAWYLFVLATDRFLFPVLNITNYWTIVQNGLSAAERIFALIDTPHTVVQEAETVQQISQASIDFDHVSFNYANGTEVLHDFDLHIAPGENVAIVGHTGAGKSSIARLIARFYEFQGGSIRIGGQDIRSFDLYALRSQMGFITQVPFLFDGTVEDNIRFARPDITRKEILGLAQEIGKGEWLETLSQGLDTPVGERGAQISMGQRQLVALMRVLANKPAIFILDEATASIDPFTEKQIQEALALVLARSTSILIAHRLSTVKSADRIIVLEEGVIKEEGSHDSLMKAGGAYANLYNTYFRHQSLSYVEAAGPQAPSASGLSAEHSA